MAFPTVQGGRVLVKPFKPEDMTASGIVLVQETQEPKYEGIVANIGPGVRLENGVQMPMECKIGDHVLYSRMAGVPMVFEGEDYIVINERDILAIIDPEAFDKRAILSNILDHEISRQEEICATSVNADEHKYLEQLKQIEI